MSAIESQLLGRRLRLHIPLAAMGVAPSASADSRVRVAFTSISVNRDDGGVVVELTLSSSSASLPPPPPSDGYLIE